MFEVPLSSARQHEDAGRGQALHEAEDEVGPVELAGLPGARVAHDHPGAIDGAGQGASRHQHLGLELGPLVVVLEALAQVEVALAEDAPDGARDVGGGDVVQPLETLRLGEELEHMAGAHHVDAMRDVLLHREVVDRGEVVALGGVVAQLLRGAGLETRGPRS